MIRCAVCGWDTEEELDLFADPIPTSPRDELIDTIKNPVKMEKLQELHSELEALIKDIKSVSRK